MPILQPTVRFEDTLVIHPSDSINREFIFTNAIGATDVLAAVVSITVDPDGELTFSGASINTETFNDLPAGLGNTVAVGKAVLARPSGMVAGNDYEVTVVVQVDDADGNDIGNVTGVAKVKCRDGSESDQ